ncbi:MAG: ATP-binding protein [Solirubrobacteraceae bacterium]
MPENQWFERRSAAIRPRELADRVIGFANAGGGVQVVGLTADAVEGIDRSAGHRDALMRANADFCQPPIRSRRYLLECVNDKSEPDHLLVIETEPSDVVHANQRGEIFLRVREENRRLSFVRRQELLFDKPETRYEGRICEQLTIGDLDHELATAYRNAIGAGDLVRLLNIRGLAVGERLTIAGALLFAERPQQALPEAFVHVLRHEGTERHTDARRGPVHDKRIDGPIPRQLALARACIRELQPVRRAAQRGSVRFEHVPLVPEEAWLEGLVNAVAHRSYSHAGDHVRVEIFDDRIEIWSPGRFLELVDLHDPTNVTRLARNPRIARVCGEVELGQKPGDGITRMFQEMRAAGLGDPVYRQGASTVQLRLLADPVNRALDASLSFRGRAIVALLRQADRLSTGEITDALGESRPVVQRELGALRDAGAVTWMGRSARDPRAHWLLG